jgi:hypothetical protein
MIQNEMNQDCGIVQLTPIHNEMKVNKLSLSRHEVTLGCFILAVFSILSFYLITDHQKETQAIAEKNDIAAIKQQLVQVIQTAALCKCTLNPEHNPDNGYPLTFDGTQTVPAALKIKSVYSTCKPDNSPETLFITEQLPVPNAKSGLRVREIAFKDISAHGDGPPDNTYRGSLEIVFDSDALTEDQRTISWPVHFSAKGPKDHMTVDGCWALSVSNASGGGR